MWHTFAYDYAFLMIFFRQWSNCYGYADPAAQVALVPAQLLDSLVWTLYGNTHE